MSYAIKQTICAVLLAGLAAAILTSENRAQAVNTRASQVNQFKVSSEPVDRHPETDPAKLLADAHTIYVWSRTVFVKQEVIESALLKRDDFRRAGLLITKDASAADLVLTVRRSNFTTVYPYDVVDQKSGLVIASGTVNSLFGTAADKIAKGFTKQLQQARKTVSQ